MRVHADPFTPKHRLRHERRVKTVTVGHVLHDESKRADVVRCNQRVVVSEIDFVLARRDLVVRGLDVKAHLLEGKDDLAANVLTRDQPESDRSSRRSRAFRWWARPLARR